MITEINSSVDRVLGNTKFIIKYKYNGTENIVDCWGQENYRIILDLLIKSQCYKTIPYQRIIYTKGKK